MAPPHACFPDHCTGVGRHTSPEFHRQWEEELIKRLNAKYPYYHTSMDQIIEYKHKGTNPMQSGDKVDKGRSTMDCYPEADGWVCFTSFWVPCHQES